MLRKFLYLDEPGLDGYLSASEDGLRTRLERSEGRRGSLSPGADLK